MDNRNIRKSLIVSVLLSSMVCIGQSAAADFPWVVNAEHTLVKPDQMLYIADPNTVNVPFQTSGQIVTIEDEGGIDYFATWTMVLSNLTPGEDIIDHDISGRNVRTDDLGYWQHPAKGSGVLSGSRNLGPGLYQAYVKTRIDATRLHNNRTKFNNYELWKDYRVTTG